MTPDWEPVTDTSAEVSEAAGPVVVPETVSLTEEAETVDSGKSVLSGRSVELADPVEVRLSLGTNVSDDVSVTEGSTTEVVDSES